MEDEKATQDRNKALADLNHEWETYKTVLIAAYGQDNQALEEFGITVPAEGIYKRRKTKKTSPDGNNGNTNNLANHAPPVLEASLE
jgi:hypothetical protein